jgi:Rhs element Vgr protein
VTAPASAAVDAELVTFSIKVGGREIDSTYQVESIDVWTAVNRLPRARIVIFDGSAAEAAFPIASLGTFVPGARVEIGAGYDSQDAPIYQGVIVKQGIEVSRGAGSKLVLELSDEAVKMTLERKNALFEKVKDSDLIAKLIAASGLKKDVAPTSAVNEEIVQYYASDWDLMLMRAELNGMVAVVEAGKVTVKPPDTSQAPALTVKYGDDILELEAEMDAASQLAPAAIKSFAWDAGTQKLVESGPGSVSVKEPGNLSSAELARVFGVKRFTQQTGGALDKAALQAWSSAELLKSRLAKIRGFVRFQGSAKVRPGGTLELAGLGARFNGTVFVSAVHQSVTGGRWITGVEFGLSPRWFAAAAPDVAAPGASGQLPPIRGLQAGIVKQTGKDPAGEFRVLVTLPLIQEGASAVWARLGTFYASNKVGAFFYPEVGDEVVVAFMNEDPRFPVILGSVYSKKLAPPLPPDEKNLKKALVTKGKLQVLFDDDAKVIEIQTPGKHVIKLDDKSGALSIRDGNDNNVTLSKGGVSITSASNLKLTAKANITVEAGANLDLKAKANASIEGLQVAHKAKAKFAANGAASAEITSSGMLTVRGTLVKIN